MGMREEIGVFMALKDMAAALYSRCWAGLGLLMLMLVGDGYIDVGPWTLRLFYQTPGFDSTIA